MPGIMSQYKEKHTTECYLRSSVLLSLVNTNHIDKGLLPQFVTTELEGTLKEVTSGSGSETSQKGTSTLSLDDLTETTNHTLVVDFRRKLDTGLDDIDGGHSAVGDGAAHGTGEGETSVKADASGGGSSITSRGGSDEVLLKGRLRGEHFW
jgi:hypothetical protein